jgi:hypothetical protein
VNKESNNWKLINLPARRVFTFAVSSGKEEIF